MKQEKHNKGIYRAPAMTVVELESETMLAMSGGASDSDDSEFSAPAQRRGAWGDLWRNEK